MSRKLLFCANWKMHVPKEGVKRYVGALKRTSASFSHKRDVLVAPSFPYLQEMRYMLKAGIRLCSQNVHWERSGAFTGEVSAEMLRTAGASFVIIGHSERKKFFGETDAVINKKIRVSLSAGLIPILCIGETLSERKSKKTLSILKKQLSIGLFHLPRTLSPSKLVIAYEPVWAIGTGRVAIPAVAQEAHAFIRRFLSQEFSNTFAARVRIIYGGSVNTANIALLLSQEDIDGALVGGASLTSSEFIRIIKTTL